MNAARDLTFERAVVLNVLKTAMDAAEDKDIKCVYRVIWKALFDDVIVLKVGEKP